MAEPARRPPRAGGPGRNKSFRKAREAAEDAQYLDMSLEDVQKYFSPDTWRKMSGMNLQSMPASSVQKYFDPVAWDKLQRLGCLRGRPTTTSSSSSSASSSTPSQPPAPSAPASAAAPPLAAARGCFSPRSWEALTRLNVVPAPPPPRGTEAEADDDEDEDDDDGFLGRGMHEDDGEGAAGEGADGEGAAALSSAVRLDGLEGRGQGGFGDTAPRAGVAERLQRYFSQDQWRKLRDKGVLENALRRMSRETSV